MNDNPFIDTNILVYAYDADSGEKHEICRNLIQLCWKGKQKLSVSNQVISEFYAVATKKMQNPLTSEQAELEIRSIIAFSNWTKLNYTTNTILHAILLSYSNKMHYWDALIAATMLENGITTIYTENEKDFKYLSGINVINPLNTINARSKNHSS